jgi:tetratricopeptide (TPR) repeat protein
MYRRMEIEEGVATDAEDYVRIAVRLGTDRTARAALSRRLLERCPRLFEDANVVREFERFFAFAVDDARARPPLAPPPALPGEAQARAEVERGNALGEEGDFEAAEACFRRALQWLPDAPAILANLGSALQFLGRSEEAVALCERALAIDPGFARAHCNLAAAQRNLGRHEAAIASARRAAALSPGLAYGHNDLAATLIQLRRLGEAEASIEEALRREPDNVDAHWNRAFLLLLQGRYEEGWREYEWRWVQDRDMRRQAGRFLQPRWRGEAAAGKTVLLHTEQGLGDGIQFIRYAPLVAARGLRVLCHCAPALEKLLALADGVERVVRPDAPERIDYHCPLMSLPLVFGTTLDTIPAQAPYLRLPPALLERWAARLGPREGPRVGLAWSSNPHRENRKVGTARSKLHRACPASLLAPLARVAGVQFVSLQKDPPPGEVPHLPLLDLMGEVDDLVDTAAIVSQLDLVISIDTCVAHLAGALGKPLWVMLPFDNEWRWLLDRADSPWYPTARLYRQRRAGDWEQVVAEVAMDLSSYRP